MLGSEEARAKGIEHGARGNGRNGETEKRREAENGRNGETEKRRMGETVKRSGAGKERQMLDVLHQLAIISHNVRQGGNHEI